MNTTMKAAKRLLAGFLSALMALPLSVAGTAIPGDVVNIPVGVKHWHGAAPDSWFSHLAVEVPGENGSNEWLEPVSDEAYASLS